MKKLLFTLLTMLTIYMNALANVSEFSISPYVPEGASAVILPNSAYKLLNSKLIQIVTSNKANGGTDNRFIIVPYINVISQETTASIPQKTIAKVSITFCVGDGISGNMFDSKTFEYTGVGESLGDAVSSAILKIRDSDEGFKSLIENSKVRIISYYNENGGAILNRAKAFATNKEYEKAIELLLVIPSCCNYFNEAQSLLSQYSHGIVERNNSEWLLKAKNIWASSQDYMGAETACEYLSNICITDDKTQREVNALIMQINKGVRNLQDREYNLAMRQIESAETIHTAEIQASAQVKTALIEAAPKVIYNITRWFMF